MRFFKVVDILKNDNNNTYEIKDHHILGKYNRYKLPNNSTPYYVAKKAVLKIYQKDPNKCKVINQIVLRETTRNKEPKLYFYQAFIEQLPPEQIQERIINGKIQIFKHKINVEAILPEVLKHSNPLSF